MIYFVFGAPIATAFLLYLITQARDRLDYYNLEKVKARTLDEAKKCDGYWPGKPGRKFSLDEKRRAYERANHRCQRARCGKLTTFGDDNERGEKWKQALIGADDGHAGHRVPFKYGGGKENAGAIWLCADCNLRESDEINEYVLRDVRREGKKIYVG